MKLTELEILTLDCQATGANPQKGHLLEIGWAPTSGAADANHEALAVSAYLVALPPEVEIPPAVQRVTGITPAEAQGAISSSDVWHKLIQAAQQVAAANQSENCPVIIHYCRFEKAFIEHLHAQENQSESLPFDIICTHEIAKRLLPGLPRRGLRAVAGYLGHSVPRQRRSGPHAVATAVIWQHFVQRMAAEHGVTDLNQLTSWLKHTASPVRTGRDYPMRPEIRLNLPDRPGIYRMLRSNGDLLYIGKATSLKQRVNSYFRQKSPHAEHTLEMLSQAVDLKVTRTGSTLEAAVLESDEIKRHCPPYNIALQTGQRSLAFFSNDLHKCASRPDAVHCIGPLPSGNATIAMTTFADWHQNIEGKDGGDFLQSGYAMLGVPRGSAPEPDCLAEGLALFQGNHQNRLKNPSALRTITGLGRELWHEKFRALANAKSVVEEEIAEDVAGDVVESPEAAPDWTPESVARGIEHFIRHAAHLIRRSRWLCLLSESSLAWESGDGEDHHRIVLVFKDGAVALREEMAAKKEIPLSTGHGKRMAERRKFFDVTTYERLRVVTTELRRLVGEGRNIELRLGPKASLGCRQLSRVLPWV